MVQIKAARKAVGMSQANLAKMVGVTQGAVSQWERGITHPGFKILPKLAQALKLSLDDLIGG